MKGHEKKEEHDKVDEERDGRERRLYRFVCFDRQGARQSSVLAAGTAMHGGFVPGVARHQPGLHTLKAFQGQDI
ncbi:hypothetical protein [Burkholderia sp. Bp8998]|uniref:hypothetical protein n=1 Tax=Burkholderia sp. Bp8998 TaxID=2184557 RepID=UPI000F5A5D2B|nr:hypothetical protein [Burkholderia sp. Bp8998]